MYVARYLQSVHACHTHTFVGFRPDRPTSLVKAVSILWHVEVVAASSIETLRLVLDAGQYIPYTADAILKSKQIQTPLQGYALSCLEPRFTSSPLFSFFVSLLIGALQSFLRLRLAVQT